ncbi:GNAT family N-acetyltransferase [Thalassotalea agarivorans]|uniref:Predicted N-acyltransferase, GNAT family n=2 Tax=Thalassotalea agarivorans TaxID=349064 RepID=A0A1I0HUV5_THASX|nr:GNAT family N-acetyltransferase [Thalassotalea agarivorans]SET87843.1 Predicted N-acyltransferase, GNAT family [Thalassotalea agarivorans]
MKYIIRSPQTPEEFEQYYQLRYQILRQPWQQPIGSEKDELEDSSKHIIAVDKSGMVVAVGRIHQASASEAQIRYMAVQESSQGEGLGAMVIEALEQWAKSKNLNTVVLNARENALAFYLKLGYRELGFSHCLYGEVNHFKMAKDLL